MASSELISASFVPNQGVLGPTTVTLASASTIAPTTPLTIVTGTTQLVTITPPLVGFHILYLVFPDAMGAFSTGGNILVAANPDVNIPVAMIYNPVVAKYYPGPIS